MTRIPDRRVAIAHGTLAALYQLCRRGDLADCEIVRLVSWLALNGGVAIGAAS